MTKRRMYPLESQEQKTVMEWAARCKGKYPELELLHHIPNGGSRNKIEAANLKLEGVKAGVPDLCLPVAKQGYHGLYIEMKAMKGRLQESQKVWIEKLKKQGYRVEVCYGFEQAKEVLENYLS